MLKKIIIVLPLLLLPVIALADNPGVTVKGTVTPGHAATFANGYTIQDGGPLSSVNQLTGDVSGTASGTTIPTTLATVNSTTGTFGGAAIVPVITANGKGLLTNIGTAAITPAAIGAPTLSGTGATGTWGIGISGNAATVTTNANLTGDVTSVGNAATISTATVTGKALTGFLAGAGTVSATDSILTAFNKVVGNINALVSGVSSVFGRSGVVTAQTGDYSVSQVTGAAPLASPTFTGTVTAPTVVGNLTGNASGSAASFTGNLTGDVTGTQSATAIAASTVTGKVLTGYVSGAGTVSATDSILTAIQKLNGNITGFIVNLASGVTGILPYANGGTGYGNAGDANLNLAGNYNISKCGSGYATHPAWCSGSDIGAWHNAAVAAIGSGSGKITIDPFTSYAQTTQAVKPHNVEVDCQMSKLVWQATTGNAWAFAEVSTSDYQTVGNPNNGAMYDCNISTLGGYTTGNTNVGVFLGGDPAGVITPSTYYAPFPTLINTQISGFYRGLWLGSNSWNLSFEAGLIFSNYDAIYAPVGNINEGEVMSVTDSTIYDNINCGLDSTVQDTLWDLKGDKFDYNINALCGTQVRANVNNFTMEQVHGPMINFSNSIQLTLNGGQMSVEGGSSGGEHGYIYNTNNDTNYNNVAIDNVQMSGNYAVPYLVYTGALNNYHLHTGGLRWTATGTLSGSNPPDTDATNTIYTQNATNFSTYITVGAGRTVDATPSNSINLYHTTTTAYSAASADTFAPVYIYNNSTATGAATGITFRQDGSGSTGKASIIVTTPASGSSLMHFNPRTGSVQSDLECLGNGGATFGGTYCGNTPPSNGASFQGAVDIGTSTLPTGIELAVAGPIQTTTTNLVTVGTAIASASTIAPITALTHITGTGAIATITPPTGMSSTIGGCIDLIADAAWTTVNTGNINTVITAFAGTPYLACYDGSKWFIK